MAQLIVCPDCETKFTQEIADQIGACPNCGVTLGEIAARPRKRAPKEVKTITLYRYDSWRKELGSATYKDNPVRLTLIEDHSTSGIFRDLQIVDKAKATAVSGYDPISVEPDEPLRSQARHLEYGARNAARKLKAAKKARDRFYRAFPQAHDLYEEWAKDKPSYHTTDIPQELLDYIYKEEEPEDGNG